MATGGGRGEVTLIANYSGKRLSLTVPTNAKIGDVVQKAVETLGLKKEDLPLSLLYQGNPIDDMTPLDVSDVSSEALEGVARPHSSGQCFIIICVYDTHW